ncbi:MAG: nucleotide sugar dehydrogenase [Actinobacteria bacterium]|nr:nucleotide sugar dehydrogenase [Actinomycetota bacterium]
MERFKGVIKKNFLIKDAINKMAGNYENKFIAGMAVIVDDNNKVLGVLTDGDIRRGISKGINVDESVEKVANFNPVVVNKDLDKSQMAECILNECKKRNKLYNKYSKIILIDNQGCFYDVVLPPEIFEETVENKKILIYGMGYIGLTLAVVLSNAGLQITGIEKDEAVIKDLQNGKPHFFENGLDSLLNSTIQEHSIQFTSDVYNTKADIYIICVGTPFNKINGLADLSQIQEVSQDIANKIKKNDLIILRSTVPVGTTRNIVIPIIQSNGYKAGDDFHISFAPERTVEGIAIEELRTLPQVIGGFDKKSVELTAKLFNKITKAIIDVESLEEAELVKLINNANRDLSFAFANEVAYICEKYNINAFKLIDSANEGYIRDPISRPSPGVGGPCLSKDPLLFSLSQSEFKDGAILGSASRKINSFGAQYVYNKIEKFCEKTGKKINLIKIFIIGLAFKGIPETSDIRDSIAVDLINLFPNENNIFIKDFIVDKQQIEQTGCNYIDDIYEGFKGTDVILIMNNHYKNNKFNTFEALKSANKPFLFFDGWNMFNQDELEKNKDCFYSTMGYMTNR